MEGGKREIMEKSLGLLRAWDLQHYTLAYSFFAVAVITGKRCHNGQQVLSFHLSIVLLSLSEAGKPIGLSN